MRHQSHIPLPKELMRDPENREYYKHLAPTDRNLGESHTGPVVVIFGRCTRFETALPWREATELMGSLLSACCPPGKPRGFLISYYVSIFPAGKIQLTLPSG